MALCRYVQYVVWIYLKVWIGLLYRALNRQWCMFRKQWTGWHWIGTIWLALWSFLLNTFSKNDALTSNGIDGFSKTSKWTSMCMSDHCKSSMTLPTTSKELSDTNLRDRLRIRQISLRHFQEKECTDQITYITSIKSQNPLVKCCTGLENIWTL